MRLALDWIGATLIQFSLCRAIQLVAFIEIVSMRHQRIPTIASALPGRQIPHDAYDWRCLHSGGIRVLNHSGEIS